MRWLMFLVALAFASTAMPTGIRHALADHDGRVSYQVEGPASRPFVYVVFHSTDRDGFCDASLVGAVSLHPHLDIPVDFLIDGGDGIIIETSSSGGALPRNPRAVEGVRTFSTARNALSGTPIRAFPASRTGVTDECQAWVKIAQSIPGPLNILVIAHTPEGDLGTDVIIDSRARESATLTFRWTLVTYGGTDGAPPAAALADGGAGVKDGVTAIYGWNAEAQRWQGYFGDAAPSGANDLTALKSGQAYWVAIRSPGPVIWSMR